MRTGIHIKRDSINRPSESDPFAAGGFAVVRKAKLAESSCRAVGPVPKLVAVKFPSVATIAHNHTDVGGNAEHVGHSIFKLISRWQREITAGQRVVHPNILPFLGLCENPDRRYKELPGIVLPYCVNGDARSYINAHPEADRMQIILGVAAALLALHTASPPVVHGDIKVSNILIGGDGRALLADFGLSRIYDTRGFTTYSFNGTLRWMAIELLRAEDDVPHRVTIASDIWAFAMTILEILTSDIPFAEMKREPVFIRAVLLDKVRPKRPLNSLVIDAIWTLLQHCWEEKPENRPDIQHVGLVLDIIRGRSGDLSSSSVLEILKDGFDAIPCLGQCRIAQELKYPPYKCKWPHCSRSFAGMEECIVHECTKFEWGHCRGNL